MEAVRILGIDAGATKTAWGVFTPEGELLKSGKIPTPREKEAFLAIIEKIHTDNPAAAIGIGIAGTVSANHEDILVCTNIPTLSHLQLSKHLKEKCSPFVAMDNDARCALIGEVWKGAASDLSSCVMLTLGTGVGGAVMQKGIVLPHPQDVNKELGRMIVDPTDPFPAPCGAGSLEAFLGGKSLEKRLGVDMAEIAKAVRNNDEEAKDIWQQISYYFIQSMRMVHSQFSCKTIIIGGTGCQDLQYYLQDNTPPCPIVPAKLGGSAGLYGAARLAIDLYQEENNPNWD